MNNDNHKVYVDIKIRTLLKIALAAVGLYAIFLVQDVILLFIFVLILFSVFNPIIDKWEEEMSRRAAITALFFIIILFVIAAGLLVVPPLVMQLQSFIQNIPDYIDKVIPIIGKDVFEGWQKTIFSMSGEIGKFGVTLFNTTVGFFGGLVAVFTVLVSTFYLLADKEKSKKFFSNLPIKHKEVYQEVLAKISDKLGSWVRGQLLLMLIVGLLDYIGLLALGVDYSLTLGVWAGLTELIPYVGPILGAVPAILVALASSPLQALGVLIVFVIVQQIEAQFLVPKIMGKAVGLSPVVIIFAILIGAKLFGIVGVILAVPFAATISVLIQEYPKLAEARND